MRGVSSFLALAAFPGALSLDLPRGAAYIPRTPEAIRGWFGRL